MRLFLALPLPEPLIDRIAALQAMLGTGRIPDPDTLHITLHFLGEVPEPLLPDLHGALLPIRQPAFELKVSGADLLGGRKGKALVLTCAADPALTALHRATAQALRRTGVDLPRRRFVPHVTIARLKPGTDGTGAALARAAGFSARTGPLTAFALYASHLGPGGARHEPLALYPLQA